MSNRIKADAIKMATGCTACGYNRCTYSLHFDHIDPATKYRTRKGKTVEVADMIKGDRYAWATVAAEIAK